MNDNTKKVVIIVVAIVAVVAAVMVGANSVQQLNPKEQVVGELPMGPGGGRDAEAGKPADAAAKDPNAAVDPSGMPASALNPQ